VNENKNQIQNQAEGIFIKQRIEYCNAGSIQASNNDDQLGHANTDAMNQK